MIFKSESYAIFVNHLVNLELKVLFRPKGLNEMGSSVFLRDLTLICFFVLKYVAMFVDD